MTAKRGHRVPLCQLTLEILHAARTLGGDNPLVFPMRSGKPISASTLPKMLQYHRIRGRVARLPLVVPGFSLATSMRRHALIPESSHDRHNTTVLQHSPTPCIPIENQRVTTAGRRARDAEKRLDVQGSHTTRRDRVDPREGTMLLLRRCVLQASRSQRLHHVYQALRDASSDSLSFRKVPPVSKVLRPDLDDPPDVWNLPTQSDPPMAGNVFSMYAAFSLTSPIQRVEQRQQIVPLGRHLVRPVSGRAASLSQSQRHMRPALSLPQQSHHFGVVPMFEVLVQLLKQQESRTLQPLQQLQGSMNVPVRIRTLPR